MRAAEGSVEETMFLRRTRQDPDPHVHRKVHLFFFGAALAFVGIALDVAWVVGVGIAVLMVGFALRFLPSRPSPDDSPPGSEGGEDR